MNEGLIKLLEVSFYWEEVKLSDDGMPIYLTIEYDKKIHVIIPPCNIYLNGGTFVFSTIGAAQAFIEFLRSQIRLMMYLEALLAFSKEKKNQELLRLVDNQLSKFLEMLDEQERVLNEQFSLQPNDSSPEQGM